MRGEGGIELRNTCKNAFKTMSKLRQIIPDASVLTVLCALTSEQGDFHEYKKSILQDFKDKKAHPAAEQYQGK